MKIVEIETEAYYPEDIDYAVVYENSGLTFIIEGIDAE